MSNNIRPLALTGATLASIGALVVTTPAISANAATAPNPALMPVSPVVALLSHDGGNGKSNGYAYGYGYDDDDDYGYDDDDDDDDDNRGGGGGFGNFIADFLANNQEQVLAVTALIPTFYLGPVAVGNAVLATAYYSGYEGSEAGLAGVLAYVVGQFTAPSTDLVQNLVLGVTSLIPQFNIGPVAVGNSLLATAYFNGYDGSAVGLPGLVSYVTSQLGLQAPAAGAAIAPPVTALDADSTRVVVNAAPAAAAVKAAVPDSGDDDEAADGHDPAVEVTTAVSDTDASDDDAGKAGAGSAGRSGGRGSLSAKTGDSGGSAKARTGRSARSGGGA